jgi:glycosyltransferase involved in cell wall biosynthesis
MKVALIHDHLAQDGGAEKVLKVLAEMFPDAPIYTLLYEPNNVAKNFAGRHIETSVIQKLPGGIRHYKWYLYFMPLAVEFFDLRNYDLVISDASAFSKGVITAPHTTHICYCHTPTRYLWSDAHEYLNELPYNKWLKKIISLVLGRLRLWDYCAAQRVEYFIANSQTVAGRIKKYYRRESEVIFPPVETNRFTLSDLSQQPEADRYFLAGCRLAPYKRIDLVVAAFKQLGDNYKLKIFGDGIDSPRLKKLAAGCSNIEFLGQVSEEDKARLFSGAQAFINPQEEDFGITVVESMAAGRPVIAYKRGGATETIVAGKTGLFFTEETAASLTAVIKNFRASDFYPLAIRQHAEQFSVENFKRRINDFILKNYQPKL